MNYHNNMNTLYNLIKDNKLDILQKIEISYQILNCVSYLHSNFIYHRNINLESILIINNNSNCEVKFFDFFLSCKYFQNCNNSLYFQG